MLVDSCRACVAAALTETYSMTTGRSEDPTVSENLQPGDLGDQVRGFFRRLLVTAFYVRRLT